MVNKINTENIAELTSMKITYETCAGGQVQETVYIVTDDDYGHDNEASIGYILNRDGITCGFQTTPTHFGFDGHVYPSSIAEEKVIEIIGEAVLAQHKAHMKAIEGIWNHDTLIEMMKTEHHESSLPKVKCVDCGTEMPLTETVKMIKTKDGYVCDSCSFGRSQ